MVNKKKAILSMHHYMDLHSKFVPS
uniref:Uncharacterized protein n=1 Tax=Rhizophora mucronata TaxID=61149 RepID=A0A2P2P9N2_RHIMU